MAAGNSSKGNSSQDVAVVGSGPNGLAAAVVLARAGLRVAVYEAEDTLGGGARSHRPFDREVIHDVCSAVHPMAAAARFFREFDLTARGVELGYPDISYGHPLPDGRSGLAYPDLAATVAHLGVDGPAWHALMAPLVAQSTELVDLMLSDVRTEPLRHLPAAPALVPRVLRHGTGLARGAFRDAVAPAMLAGLGGHLIGALPSLPAGAIALLLGHLAHTVGWPVVRGGTGRIVEALLADLNAHGGTAHAGTRVDDLRLLDAPVVLLDLAPAEFLRIAGPAMPAGYRAQLAAFRYGPGAGKVDYLLSEPIPWSDSALAAAGTVHLSGDQEGTFARETKTSRGVRASEPFVLLAQQYVADPGRARQGALPVWAYAHVPNGDATDPAELVTRVIERYAPGFRDTVLARQATPAARLAETNANYIGGDIAAGAVTLRQLLARPAARLDPYSTPLPGVYLCSASTPPGPGVHGMCGYFAARSALRREFGLRVPQLAPTSSSLL